MVSDLLVEGRIVGRTGSGGGGRCRCNHNDVTLTVGVVVMRAEEWHDIGCMDEYRDF